MCDFTNIYAYIDKLSTLKSLKGYTPNLKMTTARERTVTFTLDSSDRLLHKNVFIYYLYNFFR